MQEYRSLKELDNSIGEAKGAAFRLFKAHVGHFNEGSDFIVLESRQDAGMIARLKEEGRIYRQSHNVVLLSQSCFDQLREHWFSESG